MAEVNKEAAKGVKVRNEVKDKTSQGILRARREKRSDADASRKRSRQSRRACRT